MRCCLVAHMWQYFHVPKSWLQAESYAPSKTPDKEEKRRDKISNLRKFSSTDAHGSGNRKSIPAPKYVTYGMAFIMIKWAQNFILYRFHHQILPLLTQSCNIQNWKVPFLRQRFLFSSIFRDWKEISTMKWKIRNECSCLLYISFFYMRNLSSKLKGI